MRFVNHVHLKADFVKKEEELSFSVEENNVCMQISFFERLKIVGNDF